MKMFRILSVAALLFALMCAFPMVSNAAEYDDIIGGGAAVNTGVAPNVTASFLYAHRLREGTYSFNTIDVVSVTRKPFTVGVSATPGIAQRVFVFNNIPVYAIGTAGAVVGGRGDASYSLSTGGAAAIGIGRGFMLLPNFRILKNGLTDRQYVGGIMLTWGSGKNK
jgi:hypothetical protein